MAYKPRIPAKPTGRYRSRFEAEIGRQIRLLTGNPSPRYEDLRLTYQLDPSDYLADFPIDAAKGGLLFIIEAKGEFVAHDRKKHLALKKGHPEIEIRFVFSNASLKTEGRRGLTYGQWCNKHGFKWAETCIPPEWLRDAKKQRKT